MSRLSAPRMVLLVYALIALTVIIPVYGSNPARAVCRVQIVGSNYPSNPYPNQTISITTHLVLTCTSTGDNVIAEVDIHPYGSHNFLSTNSYFIGPIQLTTPPYNATLDVTVSNTVKTPTSLGAWKLQIVAWVLAGGYTQDSTNESIELQITALIQTTSQASTNSTSGTVESQTSLWNSTFSNPSKTGTTAVVAVTILIMLLAAFLIVRQRRKPPATVPNQLKGSSTKMVEPTPLPVPPSTAQASLPTGYPELDFLLGGGLPVGYAVIFVSPPCDEVDLIFGKIIGSALSSGHSVEFLSSHLGRSQYLASRYTKGFYVLSSQADKISPRGTNTFKIAGIDNLNDLNISFNKAAFGIPQLQPNRILIVDLLSDVLLQHKGLAARRWLDEFLATRKAEGYTVLATLNPLVSNSQENQTVIDLFDGVIEIREKQLPETSRRFLIIKKMYGRKYIDTELMLDKKRLF